MMSGCLDRKEVRGAIWGVHSTTDRPAGENTERLFLAFGGPVCADRISNCPLDRVLTYKNLIMSTPLGGGYIIFVFFAVRCPMSVVRCPASDVRRHAWFPLI